MRQIIPFTKDLNFTKNIKEITTISLEHKIISKEEYIEAMMMLLEAVENKIRRLPKSELQERIDSQMN